METLKQQHTNVLIERTEKHLTFVNPIPIRLDFSTQLPPVGFATIRKTALGYYADLDIIPGADVAGLYPAIAFYKASHNAVNGEILCLGLCRRKNIDTEIPPICASILYNPLR